MWDSSKDSFSFDFKQLTKYLETMEITKRSILSLTARIFDPLGFISTFVIQLKILFQILCTGRVEWDAPLTGESLLKWRIIISELGYLDDIKVPRCYFKFDSAI